METKLTPVSSQQCPAWLPLARLFLWDIWATVLKSWNDEPIDKVAGLLGISLQNPDFVKLCNTISEQNPRLFLEKVADRFNVGELTEDQHLEFRRVISLERNNCAMMLDAQECLERMQAAGIRQSAISNMWPFAAEHIFGDCHCDTNPHLRNLKLGRFFEKLFLSCEVGYAKPDPRIFRRAADELGVDPGEIVVIGDSIASDVKGALAAGMNAVLIDRQHKITAEVIAELPAKDRERLWVIDSLVRLLPPLGLTEKAS